MFEGSGSRVISKARNKFIMIHEKVNAFEIFRFPNGGFYGGGVLEGQMHGLGVYIFPDGSCYVGDFAKGVMEGKGSIFTEGLSFEAQFLAGKVVGIAKVIFADSTVLKAPFYDGLPVDILDKYSSNDMEYNGEFDYDPSINPNHIIYSKFENF